MWPALLASCLLCAACSATHVSPPPLSATKKSKPGSSAVLPTFPDTGINATTLTVTGIAPGSGPFAGGNQVLVRGSGFTDNATVFIGEHMVQPADTELRDRNTLAVIVPAGEPGLADVKVQLASGDEASQADAYTYNALWIDPTSGSVAGNTSILITVSSATFDDQVSIAIGGQACTDLDVISPNQLRCKTPAGAVGFADVVAVWPMGQSSERPTLVAKQAFEYKDLTDTDYGGLGGGPIDGTINITVVDSTAGMLIPNAYVLLGDDTSGPYQGRTDKAGHITFTGDDVHGPVTVHVTANCMERASIVAFDAQNVTVHVTPSLDPNCGMPGDASGGGRGTAGSMISGELIFPGANEFTVNNWDVLPEPRDNEVRVTYIFTTRSAYNAPNPSPNISGSAARILEESSPVGERGYPYRIFARPAGLAVYAISGLERRDSGEFFPYVMGVTRNVLTSPGQETSDVDIQMNLMLDHEQDVSLRDLPTGGRTPEQFRVQTHIDLGGQGVIVRQVNGITIDLARSVTSGSLFRFFDQPALQGNLADARYLVIAGWYSGDRDDAPQPPYTQVRRVGVLQTPDALTIDDFLPIPRPVAPLEGARLPADRILRWQAMEPVPDMYILEITDGNRLPAWTQFVPGTLTQSALPDFSSIDGLSDIAPGLLTWTVRAIEIDGFVYDELMYNQLSSRFWTHTSIDTFTLQL